MVLNSTRAPDMGAITERRKSSFGVLPVWEPVKESLHSQQTICSEAKNNQSLENVKLLVPFFQKNWLLGTTELNNRSPNQALIGQKCNKITTKKWHHHRFVKKMWHNYDT